MTTTPSSFIPSYQLWDAESALYDYGKTGMLFMSSDNPPADDQALMLHTILFEVPVAKRILYDFGFNPAYVQNGQPQGPAEHYTIRVPGTFSAAGSSTDASDFKQDYTGDISTATGIPAGDVPLAMFAGLIHQVTASSTDTTSGAWIDFLPTLFSALVHAFSGNYAGLAQDASQYAATYQAEGNVAHDKSYYRTKITSRSFLPVTTGPGLQTALAAIKSAHASGTSIADALDWIADQGIRTNLFRQLAGVHRANEQQVARAVSDPGFVKFAQKQGSDPVALKQAWLLDAGAPISSQAVSGLLRMPSGAVSVRSGLGSQMRSLSTTSDSGSSAVGLVALAAAAGVVYFIAKRKKGRR